MSAIGNIRGRLVEACMDLVAIDSVTGNEHAIANYLERWARSCHGLTRDDVIRHGNALVVGQVADNKPCVALVGHIDTVPAHDGYLGPSCDDERVVGLGASDMKGAVAVMQALYESLDVTALPFSVLLLLYDREEGPYVDNGLQPLLDSYEALRDIDLAIAMEPTDNTLQLGCLGSIQAQVTYRGRAAHSARPWQGDNAIHKAGLLLAGLATRPIREVNVGGLTFREAMSVTIAHGGSARNVIPDRFELTLNYRFAPGPAAEATVAAALEEIRAAVGEGEVEVNDIAPPGTIPVDNPILEHFQSHADLRVEPKQAWTDVARLCAHGIDAVNFGPGAGGQAHQANESIDIDGMVEAYEILARTLTAPLEGFDI